MRRYLPFILVLLLLLLFLWFFKRNSVTLNKDDSSAVETPFNRNQKNIQYSRHAKCRMECRQIDEDEIAEILHSGKVNYSRVAEDKRGKTYPLEGRTSDGQKVRVVIAPYDNKLVVVTVIDLEKEWNCNCD